MSATDAKTSRALAELSFGLLPDFIRSKLEQHIEPIRKGTPKGEPVGFSLAKYKASLYALHDEDLKAQAKNLGTSYGVLRKWRSEEAFKELVDQHEKELTTLFLHAARISSDMKGPDFELHLLEKMKGLLQGKTEIEHRKGRKDVIIKLMILIHKNIREGLMNVNPPIHDIRKYQRLALELATELLQDRQLAIKHRNDILMLISGLRETL